MHEAMRMIYLELKISALVIGSYKVRHSALVEFLTINENRDLTNPYDAKLL